MGKTYTHPDQEAIELGHVNTEIKILLEYLFEINSKIKTFCKWCNDKDIIADSGPCASTLGQTRGKW